MEHTPNPVIENKDNIANTGGTRIKNKHGFVSFLRRVSLLLLAILFIRVFLVDSFYITSPSMEGELLVGDYVFISKLPYGPRGPATLSIPFLSDNLTFFRAFRLKTYFPFLTLPYYRLPNTGKISRNDIVAFNLPVEERPVPELKTVYIKRCVGIAGDTITIDKGELIVNHTRAHVSKAVQLAYKIISSVPLTGDNTAKWSLHNFYAQITALQARTNVREFYYRAIVDSTTGAAIAIDPKIISFTRILEPTYYQDLDIFPHSANISWNKDNFGPLYIPAKNSVVSMDPINASIYFPVINRFEHRPDLRLQNNRLIDSLGQTVTSYRFTQDYYFMMGDNTSESSDSRSWGLVPWDHIIGKVSCIWFSRGNGSVRWNRVFRKT